jgi:hypothetical protein
MGRLAFLIIGLMIGVGAGIIGMQAGLDQYLSPAKPSSSQTKLAAQEEVTSDTYFLCNSELMKRDSTMVVRGDKAGAKLILFPGKTDSDVFRVTETPTTQYTAVRDEAGFPEAFASIETNRISGELIYTARIPFQSAKLLADICNKRIPLTECRPRIDKIRDGDWISCMSVANDMECPKWVAGSNITGRYKYQCRSAERRL